MRVRIDQSVRGIVAATILALSAACGSDSSGPTGVPTPTYDNIAATYVGVMAGTSQGVALEASFSLTVNQSAGSLSGSWSMSGNLNDGVIIVPVAGTGSLSGTIASGANPSVNVTMASPCPGMTSTFSGSYDSVNHRITLTGPVYILDGCDIFLTYQGTFILNR